MSEFSVDFDSSDDNSNSYHHRIAAKWFEISLTSLIFYVIYVIGLWKVFEKANEPGWAALIPIYNLMVEIKIAGRPYWWVLLYLIPIFDLIPYAIVKCNLGDCYGKTMGFKLGLVFLSNIFLLILGLDDSYYTPSIDSVHSRSNYY